MVKSRLLAAAFTTLFCVALAWPVVAGEFPQTRQGWQVGFGVGGGSAGISDATSREGGAAGDFHVGYAFQPQLAVELDSNLWTKSDSGVDLTFSVVSAAISCYPGAQGLVLRGGVGLGDVSISASGGGSSLTASESGLGVTVGAGYEFRVRRTFAIGPQVDFGWVSLSGGSVNYVNGALGFHWYFIPQK